MLGFPNHHGRHLALACLLLGLVPGCAAEERLCGVELVAKVDALKAATDDLVATAEELRADVTMACENIATDLGETLPMESSFATPDEYTQAVCALAQEAIVAEVEGGVVLSLAVEPPRCVIDAQAQLECETMCDVSGTCDPGTIETRCEPGELSVVCDGTCEANAYCEATADVAVNCDGYCEGVCEGTCSGTINAAGQCDGTCSGGCRGSCLVEASGGIDCGAMARCRGGCDGTATLPQCETELVEPTCDIDAECEAGCEGQARLDATCTEGRVFVVVESGNGTALATTLEENLPTLYAVAEGFAQLLADADLLLADAQAVANEVQGVPACAAALVNDFLATVDAALTAAASVEVTIEASVCVSSSTDGTPPPDCESTMP